MTKVTHTWPTSASLTNPILLGSNAARKRELENLGKQIANAEAVVPKPKWGIGKECPNLQSKAVNNNFSLVGLTPQLNINPI